jgi:hypothetical protein
VSPYLQKKKLLVEIPFTVKVVQYMYSEKYLQQYDSFNSRTAAELPIEEGLSRQKELGNRFKSKLAAIAKEEENKKINST